MATRPCASTTVTWSGFGHRFMSSSNSNKLRISQGRVSAEIGGALAFSSSSLFSQNLAHTLFNSVLPKNSCHPWARSGWLCACLFQLLMCISHSMFVVFKKKKRKRKAQLLCQRCSLCATKAVLAIGYLCIIMAISMVKFKLI